MEQLYTRWGKALDPNDILQEYPRPLLRRESYVNLNGYWDYAFTKKFKKPETYDGRILVPFSPESVLSGVERQLKPDEYLWYRRQFDCSMPNDGTRLILHFGAVDQACRVYVNGKRPPGMREDISPFPRTSRSTYAAEGFRQCRRKPLQGQEQDRPASVLEQRSLPDLKCRMRSWLRSRI